MKNIKLKTKNLAVGYHKKLPILKDINISLAESNLVCLMGTNGIGKSTLLRTLAGLLVPLNGEIKIDSRNINSYSKIDIAKKVGLVLTDRTMSFNLTVFELVSYGRFPYTNWLATVSKKDMEVINKAMETLDITQLGGRKIYELSDGQLQKALIARALAQEGDIMILDEPNAHLDLNNRVEVMSLLKDLSRNEGKTILIATHELDLALQSADQFWLIDSEGQICEGPPEDLVLNGVIDQVFKLKGFDLKTGKVKINSTFKAGISVELEGDNSTVLWTRNALEREGIEIIPNSEIQIKVESSGNNNSWSIKSKETKTKVFSIKELVNFLLNTSQKT